MPKKQLWFGCTCLGSKAGWELPPCCNRPAVPSLIETNPSWDEKCQCHLLAGLLAWIWKVCSKSLSQVPKHDLGSRGCASLAAVWCHPLPAPGFSKAGLSRASPACPLSSCATRAVLATPELQECRWLWVEQHKGEGKDNQFSVLWRCLVGVMSGRNMIS